MKESELTPADIIPKKIALKFNPPMIALEYTLTSLKADYLLNINLDEVIKIYDSAEEITKWIFKFYCDIITPKVISEKQVTRLVDRLLLLKKIDQKSQPTNKNIFEPDDKRKEDEAKSQNNPEFYKSDTNFFNKDGKKSRQDQYIVNEADTGSAMKEVLKLGDRYADSKPKETNKDSDNILDEISVGSLNSLREDSSNREAI